MRTDEAIDQLIEILTRFTPEDRTRILGEIQSRLQDAPSSPRPPIGRPRPAHAR